MINEEKEQLLAKAVDLYMQELDDETLGVIRNALFTYFEFFDTVELRGIIDERKGLIQLWH